MTLFMKSCIVYFGLYYIFYTTVMIELFLDGDVFFHHHHNNAVVGVCQAFVPTTTTTTTPNGIRTSNVRRSIVDMGQHQRSSLPSSSTTTTGSFFTSLPSPLYMGSHSNSMMDRFTRVIKSNVNKFVSNIENPEKVIDQSVNELQNDLVQVRQSYAEALASQRRIQRQLDDVDRMATEWYNRAQLALRQSQKHQPPGGIDATQKSERLAREALLRREIELERKSMIQKQFDTQSRATEQLYNAIVTLEQQIRTVMSKQQQLVARARTAKATQQIQSLISGQFDSTTAVSNSMNAFTRMEQKVEAMEAAVEASIELNEMQWSLAPTTTITAITAGFNEGKNSLTKRSLEDDFRDLEQSSKIDEELEFLKNQMNYGVVAAAAIGPMMTTTTISSSSSSSSSRDTSFIPNEEQISNRVVSIPITPRGNTH